VEKGEPDLLNPKFSNILNEAKVHYSMAETIHVCPCCPEFFHLLGKQWPVKYGVPCICAVIFAVLRMIHYFEVKAQET
jgi:hypothetical protein